MENKHKTKIDDAWQVLRIQGEFIKGFDQLSQIGPCISIFGSARTKEDNPYYKTAVELSELIVKNGYGVITGGGPGIMEAGNLGAVRQNGNSVGLQIQLPFEAHPNIPPINPSPFIRHLFFQPPHYAIVCSQC